MENEDVMFLFGLVLLALILVGLVIYDLKQNINKMSQKAIELGYAEYNSTNGQWQWIIKE